WRNFTAEIHRVDTAREEDAYPPSSSPSGSRIQGYTISLEGAASPHTGPGTHSQASGGYGQKRYPWGQQPPTRMIGYSQPTGATAARRHSLLQRDARKGGRLQGARKGLPLAGAVAPTAGVVVPWKGSC
ncbi:hypothetical protein B296_00044460, partial [Ensete ventricosum]